MKVSKTRMICEAAIFIAMAEILSLIKLYEFPNGGSITLEMLPIILFAARYGCGWGSLAGLVYGTITYLIGNKFSIDWTTIICDYFLAFSMLGLGAVGLGCALTCQYFAAVCSQGFGRSLRRRLQTGIEGPAAELLLRDPSVRTLRAVWQQGSVQVEAAGGCF